jgi:hypothetical protein
MTTHPNKRPDCFDLNDWVFENDPESHRALRYISPDGQYEAFKRLWIEAGSPLLETIHDN